MPKGNVNDPISDVEVAFALLVLGGKLTDREAAEAVGINPENASYVKSKRVVQDYMGAHRAAVTARIASHEAATLVKFNASREELLCRLLVLANLDPETTKGSIMGQIKAIDSIAALMGYGPEPSGKSEAEDLRGRVPRAAWMDKEPNIYRSAWMDAPREQKDSPETAAAPLATPTLSAAPQFDPEPDKPLPVPVPIARPQEPSTNKSYSLGPQGRASWVPGAN
jgi:hypothetical protein